jgi:molybdate transport system ATP-binding protein
VSISVQIHKQLGSFTVDAQFSAPAGITALFGPSGSGKTVTLRCIAGLIQPEHGQIEVNGDVLFDDARRINIPARDRQVGYLFQQYALFPHLRVEANVAYGLHRHKKDERARRVKELLEIVGMQNFAERYPKQLSGGQQQRVALARALAPSPELVLLDEPFTAVDALVRGQLRQELAVVQKRMGIPMLLVTHDLTEVKQLASYVVLYHDGQVVQQGPTAEVLASPSNEDAAALLTAAGSF